MKRITILFILLAVMLPLCGCREEAEPILSPVTFYYSRAEFDHGNENSVIHGEIRESAGYEGDLIGLLNLYLNGPISEEYKATFPAGTKLKDFQVEDKTAVLTVTDQLSLARGINLTIACACLTKTVLEMTGLDAVKIQAETVNLGNSVFILMDRSSLLLLDAEEIHP